MADTARERLDTWMRLKTQYDELLSQYVSLGNPPIDRPKKALTQEALEELKSLWDATERAHRAWLDALQTRGEKSA